MDRHTTSIRSAVSIERLLGLAAAALLVALLAAASAGANGAAGPIKIGLIADQTGTFSALGTVFVRGAQTEVNEWNSARGHRRISLQICDSQSTGDGAISCYLRFKGTVDGISGPHLFVGLAAAKSLEEQGSTPTLSLAPLVYPKGNSSLYQLIPTIPAGVVSGFKWFKSQGYTKVATLTSNDQPGNLAKKAAATYAKKYGLTLASQQVFDPTSQNLTPQAESITNAGVQAVLTWTAGAQVVTALRALKNAGVTQPILMSFASMTVPLLSLAGSAAGGNLRFFATNAFDQAALNDQAYRKRVAAFTDYYQNTFKLSIDLNALGIGDTIGVLAQAIQAGRTPKGTIDVLNSGRKFQGLLFPTYSFGKWKHYGRKSNDQAFAILAWQPDSKSFKVVG